MTAPVSIEHLSVRRDGLQVVTGFSYASASPAWIGLVGANGSGKTSLLRALAGRLPIEGGRILLGGVDVSADRAARAQRVGFAVDAAMLPADLTPRELFAITAMADGAAEDPALRGLREALDVERFLDRECGSLSAGMGQRIAILAAFLDLPGIVILDEPFNWLDPLTAFDVKAALRALVAARGITLFTALHDIATLTAYCDRGVLMSGGRIALTIEKEELRSGLADPVTFEAAMVARLRAAR